MPPKAKFPCLVCRENVGSGSLACCVCQRWVHPNCIDLPQSVFEHFVQSTKIHGHHFWGCEGCTKGAHQLTLKVNAVEEKLKVVEKNSTKNTKDIEEIKERMDKYEQDKLTEGSDLRQDREGIIAEAKQSWSTELRERESKRLNLVLHNVPEPPADLTANKARKGMDEAALVNILGEIGVRVTGEDIKFLVRPGPVSQEIGRSPRPLLVGLRSPTIRESILDNAKKLKNSRNFSKVSIVPDLTKQQRKDDKALMDEADRRNEDLGDEEGNFEWRCLGRKGERVLVKVKVHNDSRMHNRARNNVMQQPIRPVVPQPGTGANLEPLGQRGRAQIMPPSPTREEEEEEYVSGEEDVTEGVEGVRDVEGVEEGVVADAEDQQNGRKRKGNDSPTFVSSQTTRKKKA